MIRSKAYTVLPHHRKCFISSATISWDFK